MGTAGGVGGGIGVGLTPTKIPIFCPLPSNTGASKIFCLVLDPFSWGDGLPIRCSRPPQGGSDAQTDFTFIWFSHS